MQWEYRIQGSTPNKNEKNYINLTKFNLTSPLCEIYVRIFVQSRDIKAISGVGDKSLNSFWIVYSQNHVFEWLKVNILDACK